MHIEKLEHAESSHKMIHGPEEMPSKGDSERLGWQMGARMAPELCVTSQG